MNEVVNTPVQAEGESLPSFLLRKDQEGKLVRVSQDGVDSTESAPVKE